MTCIRDVHLLYVYLHFLLSNLAGGPKADHQGGRDGATPHAPLLATSALKGLHTHPRPPTHVQSTNTWKGKVILISVNSWYSPFEIGEDITNHINN